MSRIRITEDNCDAIMDERRDEEHLRDLADRRLPQSVKDACALSFHGRRRADGQCMCGFAFVEAELTVTTHGKRALSSGRLTPRSAK